MKRLSAALILLAFALLYAPTSHADTFSTGANEFTIEFVDIGDPNNPDDSGGDPDPAGKVEYAFRMGKYEISRDMITKANAEGSLGITMSDMSPFGGNGADKPATGVSWFEAATFVNWLNDQKGASPAYKFNGSTFELWQSGDAGYNAANPFRNSQAYYFLPSADEWYKAAYYDPNTGGYNDYPTGSDSAPTSVASGTTPNTAVYAQSVSQGPANIMLAGGLSPYGTMGQGGNVWEWQETEYDLVNDSGSSARGVRGGFWGLVSGYLPSSIRGSTRPTNEGYNIGFRVVSIPEPSTALLGAMTAIGLLMRRRR